jgi:hypothetical protein
MIPERYRSQIAGELSALGGNPAQIKRIGDIVFAVAALDISRDAEYLLEQMADPDPLIRRACKIMLEAMV